MSREQRAQALLLEMVLGEQPPGSSQSVGFAEIDAGAEVVLLDDRDLSEFDLPPGVSVVPPGELSTIESDDRVPVLRFLEPESMPGKISVRLRLSVLVPDQGLAPMEELVATFDDTDPLSIDTVNLLAI